MSQNSIPFGRDAFDFIDDVQHLSTGVEIMERLGVTVDEHAQTASRKLGAVNRTQAVAIAIRERLIQA